MILKINMDLAKKSSMSNEYIPSCIRTGFKSRSKGSIYWGFSWHPSVFGQMLFSSSNCAKTDYFHILFNLLFAYHPILRRFILRTIQSVIK